MYKALAEAWYWDADTVSELTPSQLLHYSGKSQDGRVVTRTAAEMQPYIEAYLRRHSPEAERRRAERLLAYEEER